MLDSRPTPLHIDHINALPKVNREALLAAAAECFYVNRPGTYISNGLSTALICFPSDTHPTRKAVLEKKINRAISYASRFRDVESLDALRALPLNEPDNYLTLGLYLYFADECSRLKCGMTFLSAMRKAGAEQKTEEKEHLGRDELYKRTLKALEMLGMEPKHIEILNQWHDTGSYEIQNDPHTRDDEEKIHGAYALLAESISKQQKYLGMNLAISYALANKRHVKKLNAQEAYELTARLVADPENMAELRQRIEAGNTKREKLIRKKIYDAIPPRLPSPEEMRQAKEILSQLPDNALELLCREGYSCAYANAPTLHACYPAQDFPGHVHDKHEKNRTGKGLAEPRYRILFLCNGMRQNSGDIDRNEPLKFMITGQTLLHEILHIALNKLDDNEKQPLKDAVEAVHDELMLKKPPLYFHNKLETINMKTLEGVIETKTLNDVMDFNSSYYGGYVDYYKDGTICSDTRWQEVACNAFGLMHTECNASAPHPLDGRHGQLDSLKELARQINTAMDIALAKSRKEFPQLVGQAIG